jgi:hypothetical protein
LNEAKQSAPSTARRFERLCSAWRTGQLTEEAFGRELCYAKPEHAVYFETVHVGGERGLKDTVQPLVHRSVHPTEERNCSGALGCVAGDKRLGAGKTPDWAGKKKETFGLPAAPK